MAQTTSYNRWWWYLTIGLLAVPVILIFAFGGWKIGEEFCPDDFSQRSFGYNAMPLFNITLRGIRYEDSTPVFADSLKKDGLVTSVNKIKRWDLISETWADARSPDLDAGQFTSVLDIKDTNNESIWIKWNDDHPDLAKEFWPIIATLVRQGLYIEAAEILIKGIDLQEAGRDDYLQFTKDASTAALNDLADEKSATALHEDAVEIYSLSIDIGESKRALLGRAASYDELDDSASSQADRDAASKISD